jgi:hypothetical protein
MPPSEGIPVNDKVYIHEYIDVIGHNRANYMHHMTANWSPIAQEPPRHQLCYGVWGVVGSTGRWPEVVNLWEHDGYDGIALSLGHETGRPQLQDEKLEKWWAEASNYRRGGIDRLIVPAPWTRTIEELCADGVHGDLYAHEVAKVAPWQADDFLSAVADHAVPARDPFGWELAGAFRTALHDDSECILIWAIPTWAHWAELEKALPSDPGLQRWQTQLRDRTTSFERILMNDAPLSPMKLGRQPSREDRVENWTDL